MNNDLNLLKSIEFGFGVMDFNNLEEFTEEKVERERVRLDYLARFKYKHVEEMRNQFYLEFDKLNFYLEIGSHYIEWSTNEDFRDYSIEEIVDYFRWLGKTPEDFVKSPKQLIECVKEDENRYVLESLGFHDYSK